MSTYEDWLNGGGVEHSFRYGMIRDHVHDLERFVEGLNRQIDRASRGIIDEDEESFSFESMHAVSLKIEEAQLKIALSSLSLTEDEISRLVSERHVVDSRTAYCRHKINQWRAEIAEHQAERASELQKLQELYRGITLSLPYNLDDPVDELEDRLADIEGWFDCANFDLFDGEGIALACATLESFYGIKTSAAVKRGKWIVQVYSQSFSITRAHKELRMCLCRTLLTFLNLGWDLLPHVGRSEG